MIMASPRQKKQDFGITRNGGIQQASQFFGLQEIKDFDPSSDIVFVSIDLEVSRQERSKPGAPLVKEFGIATLDTRCLATPFFGTKYISTSQYSTTHSSKDFLGCDATDFKECVFAETVFVAQKDLASTIIKSLRIRDDTSSNSEALRNIVIIGHSIKSDLKILQRLGINVYDVAPVVAILDTDLMARSLFGDNSDFATRMTNFTLSALLTKLKCPYESEDLHNGGNDATFTLHAMLMLIIKSSESREMGVEQRENLERLRVVTRTELYECERWKPSRKSLGFYANT